MSCHSHLRQSYPHWNSRQSLDSHWNKVYSHWNKEKIFWKNFKNKSYLNVSTRVKRIWQTNRQTNIWTKQKDWFWKIWIFTTFIQCNTIVQLTNYSVPRNNNTNRRVDNFLEVIIIKMHVFFHSGLIIYDFHNLWHEIYVIVYDICN